LSLPAVCAITTALSGALALADDAASNSPRRMVGFHDETIVPALGQGSARLGQGGHPEATEQEASPSPYISALSINVMPSAMPVRSVTYFGKPM
jgi:hypothetical protein